MGEGGENIVYDFSVMIIVSSDDDGIEIDGNDRKECFGYFSIRFQDLIQIVFIFLREDFYMCILIIAIHCIICMKIMYSRFGHLSLEQVFDGRGG